MYFVELLIFNIFSYTISARLGNALGMIGVSGGVVATLGQVRSLHFKKIVHMYLTIT